ncbi:MAG: hypothetical protein IT460_15305 [Planctomycetes bacterium]|nr:hypothetical protein [Planctomycetota bacterium]
MPDNPTCASCRWWAREAHPLGQCRRAAPTLPKMAGSGAQWPFTWVGDWCGDHEPSPTTNRGPAAAGSPTQPAATEP